MPDPKQDQRDGMLLNCEKAAPSRFDTNGSGEILDLNTENLAIIGDIGLGASRATLNGNAAYYPEISVDPAIRVTYIIKGSGTVKVRDFGGFVTDRQIEAGELFVVPRLLSVCKIADPDGMEWFSIVCNENVIVLYMRSHYFSSMLLRLSKNVIIPCWILQILTIFGGNDTHPATYLESMSNIAFY